MNRTFDDMTGDWLQLQRSYWESLGMAGPAATPAANGNRASWWNAVSEGNGAQLNDFFGLLMDQARMFTQLGSTFGQAAGSPESLPWNEMVRESINRIFESMRMPMGSTGWLGELWSGPMEQWRKMTSPPQGLTCALKPFTTAFTAESAGIPIRYEQLMSVLSVPGFGPTREYQHEQQNLARAWVELQKAQNAYNELFSTLPAMVCDEMGRRLDVLTKEGKTVDSLREFYDLFVDAAEARYAELVNSDTHSERYGRAVNSLMAFRRQLLDVADRFQGALNLPTRRELDGLHLGLRTLSQQNQKLHAEMAQLRAQLDGHAGWQSTADRQQPSAPAPKSRTAAPARPRRGSTSRGSKK